MMIMTDKRVAEIEPTSISQITKIALILCFQYYHSSSEPLLIISQACTHNLPKPLRTPLMLSLMEQPLTRAEPDEAGNNPVTMDIRVVFPAPPQQSSYLAFIHVQWYSINRNVLCYIIRKNKIKLKSTLWKDWNENMIFEIKQGNLVIIIWSCNLWLVNPGLQICTLINALR